MNCEALLITVHPVNHIALKLRLPRVATMAPMSHLHSVTRIRSRSIQSLYLPRSVYSFHDSYLTLLPRDSCTSTTHPVQFFLCSFLYLLCCSESVT
ncbi:hypothetical protein JAAARDRAFT_209390 [Jaapia argillacea MUCL 33604]|uniref:Uncharacterized protein n=1 Tax=Jaapia argillacea MUCL 33604 TaxID=933084 RepID=A0A067PSG9_9AGAM|nr:hypothetical protein JAAARDRAFT_209390 [Jaapia argillacea MUCL 33604]